MSQKRMTSLEVIDTDAFLDMPATSQLLYFHLNSRADDDGFVSSPKKIIKIIGANVDDLKVLAGKKFIIIFNDGVCVIKHWRINNFIRKDIYKETNYLEFKKALFIRSNGSYTLSDDERAVKLPRGHFNIDYVNELLTKRQPRLDKVSIDKIRIKKEEKKESRFAPPLLEEIKNYCLERKNGINSQNFLDFYESKGWLIGKNKMKDWKAAIRTWETRNKVDGKTNLLKAEPNKYDKYQ